MLSDPRGKSAQQTLVCLFLRRRWDYFERQQNVCHIALFKWLPLRLTHFGISSACFINSTGHSLNLIIA